MVMVPIAAVMPDLTFNLFQKVFYPTPVDWVMMQQKRYPNYIHGKFQ
jgi:hypothetical protein